MSQVIVTEDKFQANRAKSKVQEVKIDKEGFYRHWRISDVTKPNPILKLIGIASLPIVALWAFILFLLGICITGFTLMLKILGTLIPSRHK